jgi:hypothetical protein
MKNQKNKKSKSPFVDYKKQYQQLQKKNKEFMISFEIRHKQMRDKLKKIEKEL